MKRIYGANSPGKIKKALQLPGAQNIMASYFYVPKSKNLCDWLPSDDIKVWLDSGAFSAFRKGLTIDIDEYCRYINKNQDRIERYIALDDILSQEKTIENYLYMRSKGLNPVPVFHRYDDLSLIQFYIDNGADYIALGSRAPFDNDGQRREWLDKILEVYGFASVKWHCLGFLDGVADEYPFDSCDSCTWETWTSRAADSGRRW